MFPKSLFFQSVFFKMYFNKVYLVKMYFCEMYPTCVSSKLCEFILDLFPQVFNHYSSGGLGRRRSKAIFLNINIADIGVTIFPMAGLCHLITFDFVFAFDAQLSVLTCIGPLKVGGSVLVLICSLREKHTCFIFRSVRNLKGIK